MSKLKPFSDATMVARYAEETARSLEKIRTSVI